MEVPLFGTFIKTSAAYLSSSDPPRTSLRVIVLYRMKSVCEKAILHKRYITPFRLDPFRPML